MKRAVAGIVGGIIALVTLVGSSTAHSEGTLVFFLSTLGVAVALGIFWFARARHGHPWRWYHSIGLAVGGSLVTLVVAVALLNPGDSEAMGFAVGGGLSYGLVLGIAAALLVYAFRHQERTTTSTPERTTEY